MGLRRARRAAPGGGGERDPVLCCGGRAEGDVVSLAAGRLGIEGAVACAGPGRRRADAKALAAAWEGWGHRKLAELKRVGAGGVSPGPVSDSTMHRVLARNGLR